MYLHRNELVEVVDSDGQPIPLDRTRLSVRVRGPNDIEFWVKPVDLREYQPKLPPKPRWENPLTGKSEPLNPRFLERFPIILAGHVGESAAIHVSVVLAQLGVDVSDLAALRQAERPLRAVKAYLRNTTGIPYCSKRSQDGGYFIAATRNEVLREAEVYRVSAAGNIQAAEEIEGLADRLFPVEY